MRPTILQMRAVKTNLVGSPGTVKVVVITPPKKIGKTQKAILRYLRKHPKSTLQQIGDALYQKHSMSSEEYKVARIGKEAAMKLHRDWAAKPIIRLRNHGLVVASGVYPIQYSLAKEVKKK